MQRLKILIIGLVITSSVVLSGNGSTPLAISDLDLTSKIVLQALQVQAKYEGKEEVRSEEIKYLKIENILMKVLICYMAVNNG